MTTKANLDDPDAVFQRGIIPWNKGMSKYATIEKNYCRYCGKEIPIYNKAFKPRKYCTEHHKMTPIHGRPFQKGQIPWNSKHAKDCDCEKCKIRRFNKCKKCSDKRWLIACQCGCGKVRCRRTRHGDVGKYIIGHEPKRPKGTTPTWAIRRGLKHYGYKGGRGLDNPERYNETRKPYHFYSYSGYIKVHRIVMENYLTLKYDFSNLVKCGLKNLHILLHPSVKVHHIDGDIKNNNPSNLKIVNQSQHYNEHHWLDGKRVLEGDRACSICDSTKTRMRKYRDYEVPEWFKTIDGKWKCRKCYRKEYDGQQYQKNVVDNEKIEGKKRTKGGYLKIRVPRHPRADRRGWVLEHIFIAEKKIGRPLKGNEQVHHINGTKDDNRLENLEVMDGIEHNRMHGYKRGII